MAQAAAGMMINPWEYPEQDEEPMLCPVLMSRPKRRVCAHEFTAAERQAIFFGGVSHEELHRQHADQVRDARRRG